MDNLSHIPEFCNNSNTYSCILFTFSNINNKVINKALNQQVSVNCGIVKTVLQLSLLFFKIFYDEENIG